MNQNRLFHRTRWRLTFWYAGVMGFILAICSLGVYEAIAHAHWQTLERELESVAGTLHDSIENTLQQTGRIEPATEQLLPQQTPESHVLGAMHQGDYYIRLLNRSKQIVGFYGFQPQGLPFTWREGTWQTLKDAAGNRYHQISLQLHSQDNRAWGYIQIGRSLQDIDDYLANARLILLLGLPIAMLLVGASSWWLAGRAMQPIYQSYRQIQQFTADAAHELRTPLAATQATVESALRIPHLAEPEVREILKSVERQNRRLTQLVADLLLLARMERQLLPVRQKLCCLNDIICDLVEELETLAINAGVTLSSKILVHKSLNVVGDEEQLYRLLSNLMINAIQYTPAKGQVTVILGCNEHQALIHVQDTGIGIAQSEQKQIFDRFYRVSSDRSRHTGGAGLGLAIASAIVQAHHGSLYLQSELGKGSIFTIQLPLEITPFSKLHI